MTETTPETQQPTATQRHESTRGLNRLFRVGVLVLVVGGVGSVFWFGSLMNAVAGVYSRTVEHMTFDSEVWKASEATESHESIRLRMADDLIANHLATGLHETRLYQMLGFPDPYQPLPGYDLMYFLGHSPSGDGTEGLWLAIKLNTRGEIQFFKVTDG